VTDAITDALADVQPEDALFKELLPLIRDNLPKKLADVAGLWLLANKCVEFAALPREPTRS